jgi:integrase
MGKLTVAKIRALKEPGRYSDGDGLILEFTRPGRAYWFVRVQHNGRRRDIGLGSVDEITLAKARDKAHEARKSLAKGIDPSIERQKAKLKVPTFREAAKLVHEEHKAAWKNGKHQDQWITTLTTYAFPRIGNRLVSDIEGPVIRDVLAPIWLSKPETARRVRQRIGVVLDWSYSKGFRTTEAPLRSISRGLPRQPKRDRHLAALPFEDVPAFLVRVREKSTIARLALEFLILAAARSGEVRGMRWPEIDLAKRVWTVPADRMKAGKVHLVPLDEGTIDVLERVRPLGVPASNLIFPGQNVKRPLSDMTLLKILRDMEVPATVHGFRSTFRDWVAEQTDYPGEIAEAALAHAIPNKVEAAYRRTDFLEKRRALMRDWDRYCRGSSG